MAATKIRLFQTRFPYGSPPLTEVNLNATVMHSPDHSTKGTPSAFSGSCHSGLWLLVSTWFQNLFHPPLGVLFTFPSRYLYAIGC